MIVNRRGCLYSLHLLLKFVSPVFFLLLLTASLISALSPQTVCRVLSSSCQQTQWHSSRTLSSPYPYTHKHPGSRLPPLRVPHTDWKQLRRWESAQSVLFTVMRSRHVRKNRLLFPAKPRGVNWSSSAHTHTVNINTAYRKMCWTRSVTPTFSRPTPW